METKRKVSKKANGEGSITQISRNGKKFWKGTITVGYTNEGKQKRKVFTGATKQEVINKIADYRTMLNRGEVSSNDKLTLDNWFHLYLFQFKKNDLKKSTFARYYSVYKNYIKNTTIGRKKLIDLRTIDFQKYYNSLLYEWENSNSKNNAKTIKTINSIIGYSINEAVNQGYISRNYAKNIKLPKDHNVEEEIKVFSSEEQKKFIDYLIKSKHELRFFFILALATGMRRSELIGLEWKNIDFKSKTITVNKILVLDIDIQEDGTTNYNYAEDTPKTRKSTRVIPLSNIIENYLLQQKEWQNTNKKMLSSIYIDSDYVFTDKMGKHIEKGRPLKNLYSIEKKLNLPLIPLHALRHTFATRLFEKGVTPKTVQELMGHSDIKTTMNIYTHVMPEQKEDAINALNDLF